MDYKIQDTTLTGIANAIRAKEGSSDPIQVNDFANRISAIESGGDGFLVTEMNAEMPQSVNWKSIAYGDGKFVAVSSGSSHPGAVSNDGINWTETTMPAMNYWNDVTYGNGMFVAVASASVIIAYSTDGVTWQNTVVFSENKNLFSVTYGDGKFVAVGGSICAVSSDGMKWTTTSVPFHGTKVVYGNGKFVALSSIPYYSEDGISWNPANDMSDSLMSFSYLTYGDGKFVVMPYNSGYAMYSTDGINWVETLVPFIPYTSTWETLVYGGGVFVALSETEYTNSVISYDGINWVESDSPGEGATMCVVYGDEKFVAAKGHRSDVSISYDGLNWYSTYTGLTDTSGKDVTGKVLSKLGRLLRNDNTREIVYFTIDGTRYKAFADTTWYDWYACGYGIKCSDLYVSEYDEFVYIGDPTSDIYGVILDSNGVEVTPTDSILSGMDYIVEIREDGGGFQPDW